MEDKILCRFIIDPVLPLIGTFLVGALGWWVTHWIARPILELEKTRQQTYELLRFYRHLSKDWNAVKIGEAEDKLRSMAARTDAASVTASKLVRWYCRYFRGWDLAKAQSALHGLSNVCGTTRDEWIILLHDVEVALRFPLSDTPERIGRIVNRVDQNDP
jgi:hypothetical protein